MRDFVYALIAVFVALMLMYFVRGKKTSTDIVDEVVLAYAFNYKETESLHKKAQLRNLMLSIASKQDCRLVKGSFKYICPKGVDDHILAKLYELSQEE